MKMDPQPEQILDFQTAKFMALRDVLRKSIDIARSSPKIFLQITLALILPLSFAILAHSRFTIPLLDIIPLEEPIETSDTRHPRLQFFIFMYGYPMFLFVFSLLSTAAVVFTAASLDTHRSVSFTSTLSAIPGIFKRLFITFLFISIVMLAYNAVYFAFLIILASLVNFTEHLYVFIFLFILLFIIFLNIHVYITAIWHLASVVSVLEPIYGVEAMKKSMKLLSGKTMMGMKLVLVYLSLCVVTNIAYSQCNLTLGVLIRYSLRLLVLGVLVIVNLLGLLVQSIFYFVCKSYHGEEIDKSVLYGNLGGYLGEYTPLQSDKEVKSSELEFEVMDHHGKLQGIV